MTRPRCVIRFLPSLSNVVVAHTIKSEFILWITFFVKNIFRKIIFYFLKLFFYFFRTEIIL
jgi:hypothetical protein